MSTELATGNVIILRRRCTSLTQRERQTSGFGDFKLRKQQVLTWKKKSYKMYNKKCPYRMCELLSYQFDVLRMCPIKSI